MRRVSTPPPDIDIRGGRYSRAARIEVQIDDLRRAAADWRALADALETAGRQVASRSAAVAAELVTGAASSPVSAATAHAALLPVVPASLGWAAAARGHADALWTCAQEYARGEQEAQARIDALDRRLAPAVVLGGGVAFLVATGARLDADVRDGGAVDVAGAAGRAAGDVALPLQHVVNALPGLPGVRRLVTWQRADLPEKRGSGRPTLEDTAAVAADAYDHAPVMPGVARPIPARPAAGLGDLLEAIPDDPDATSDSVDVHRQVVRGPDGTTRVGYVVVLRGTSVWNLPGQGTDGRVRSMGPNLQGVAGIDSPEVAAMPQILRAAGVPTGASVALVGHSQGGLTAIRAASSPAVSRQYRVTHVVTAGSPISRAAAPAGVQVLSIEHDRDIVPRLDGADDRPRAAHLTARVSRPAEPVGASHATASYARSAEALDARVDAGRTADDGDRSLADFRASLRAAGHLQGEGDVVVSASAVRVPLVASRP